MAMKRASWIAVLLVALVPSGAQAQSPVTIAAVETCWSDFVACLAAGGSTCHGDYSDCIDVLTIRPADVAGGLEGCMNEYLGYEATAYETLHCIKAWRSPAWQMASGTEIDDPCRLPLALQEWAQKNWLVAHRYCLSAHDPTEAAKCGPLLAEGNAILAQVEELDACVL